MAKQNGDTAVAKQGGNYESELVASLRKEGHDLKDCITRYSFQALSLGSVAAGTILKFIWDYPLMGIGGGFIAFMAFATCRICTHKQASANRHYGYELHLARTKTVKPEWCGRWRDEYRTIDWEEALRAWRIVQPTLFGAMFERANWWRPDVFRPGFDDRERMWHRQKSLVSPIDGADCYPGSYIQTVLATLEALAFVGICVMIGMTCRYYFLSLGPETGENAIPTWVPVVSGVLTLAAAAAFSFRVLANHVRRKILEDDILSIHSCAVIWQATVIAHYEAIQSAQRYCIDSPELGRMLKQFLGGKKLDRTLITGFHEYAKDRSRLPKDSADGAGLSGYTFWLGMLSAEIALCCKDLPAWIGNRTEFRQESLAL